MSQPTELSLTISPEKLDNWYMELAKQMPATGHQLAVAVALQSFVLAMTEPSQRGTAAEQAIKSALDSHASMARDRLLADNARDITEAFTRQDSLALMTIHRALSRRGFEIAAKRAIEEMPAESLLASANWASSWCVEAKGRAEAASGFPDALDFAKAGINPLEYAAMKDAEIYLSAVKPRARSA